MTTEQNAAADAVADALAREDAHRIAMARRYYELCDVRDSVYAGVQPLEDELAQVNAQREALHNRADEIAAQIEAGWGSKWLALKRNISTLAKALDKIPPRDSLG